MSYSSSARSERFVFLSEVESKHLICSVCSDTFDDPVITNCGHTFCRQCVQQSIDNNNNKCAECRKLFVRKRNRLHDKDLVVISNYVFSRNIIVNKMIDELMSKCDFDFNGCQQTVKFQTLASHLKQCEFRFCKTCGFTAGTADQHNCLGLMKNDRNGWKSKSEDWQKISEELSHKINILEEKVSFLTKQLDISQTDPLTSIVSCFKVTNDCIRKIDSIIIGNFTTLSKNFEIISTGMKIYYVKGYDGSQSRQHITIPFHCTQKIMYCTDPSLSAIALKPILESSQQINQSIFGTDPPEGIKLDIQSEDTKHWYITVIFKDDCRLFFSLLQTIFLVYCREYNTQSECVAIDTNLMTNIIENTISFGSNGLI